MTANVLRPELYSRLKQLFGQVAIAKQASPAVLGAPSFDFIRGRVSATVLDNGEYYYVNCPFCNDTGKRLWINYRFGQYQDGELNKHLAICYNQKCLQNPDNRETLFNRVCGFNGQKPTAWTAGVTPVAEITGPELPAALPGICVPIWEMPQHHRAVKYMVIDRRFDMATLRWYSVHVCVGFLPEDQSKFRHLTDWVVIPIIRDRTLAGWQARYPGELNWRDAGFGKYYNGLRNKSWTVYNYDRVQDKPFVVLVEGVTDVWRLGDFAVSSFGCTLSVQQATLLARMRKPVVVCLDPEAVTETFDVHRQLAAMNVTTVSVTLPKGLDPGSASEELVWGIIFRAAQSAGVSLSAGK